MNLPPLPSNWSDDHSLAFILLIVSAVDGEIDTAELGEVERRLTTLDPNRSVASVILAQDAYEYLLKASQLVDDDAEMVEAVTVHCKLVNDRISDQQKLDMLQAIYAISEADDEVDPAELAVYSAATQVWSV